MTDLNDLNDLNAGRVPKGPGWLYLERLEVQPSFLLLDGGGNRANGNGSPASYGDLPQCVGVRCR